MRLHRSLRKPIREGLTRSQLWEGPDNGLIWCWEWGRQLRIEQPELAARATRGELVVLVWKGGVEKKLKSKKKSGTLNYLAAWQGLRGEDLDLDLNGVLIIECKKTGQAVTFSAELSADDED
jgi:hypothetical protein